MGFDKRTTVEFPPKITIATPGIFAMLTSLFAGIGGRKTALNICFQVKTEAEQHQT
jgi:hypothetical protein